MPGCRLTRCVGERLIDARVAAPDDCIPFPPDNECAMRELFNRVREFDRRRPGFPGEHFLVAALGTSLLNAARRRGGVARVLAGVAGGALLARAASGRDGLSRLRRMR